MSELVEIWIVVVSGLAALVFILAMFVTSNGESNFESFVKAWKERRIAELEVEKAKVALERAKFGLINEGKP